MLSPPAGALRGLRVVDLSAFLAAPQVSAVLGDHGAHVVKVEPPGGDPLRSLGTVRGDRSQVYALVSRNKEIVEVDATAPAGRAQLEALLDTADVVVVNQPPELLQRWGCSYEAVAGRNPRIVYVSVSCYGDDGPYADLAGNGSLAEAYAGLTHLIGEADGPPVLPSVALGDSVVAMSGVIGVLLACYHRDAGGGSGQRVEVTMYEPLLALLGSALSGWNGEGPPPSRTGSRVAGGAPRNVYRAADDRWVVVSGTTDGQVARILALTGHDTPEDHARFGRSSDRLRAADELDALVAAWVAARPAAEVLAALRGVRVPAAPVNDFAAVVDDPHVRARGSIATVDDPTLGPVLLPAPTPRLTRTPGAVRWLGGAGGTTTTVEQVLDAWRR